MELNSLRAPHTGVKPVTGSRSHSSPASGASSARPASATGFFRFRNRFGERAGGPSSRLESAPSPAAVLFAADSGPAELAAAFSAGPVDVPAGFSLHPAR